MINAYTENTDEAYEYSLIGLSLLSFKAAKKHFSVLTGREFTTKFATTAWTAMRQCDREEDMLDALKKAGLSSVDITACTEAYYAGSTSYIPWLVEKIQSRYHARRVRRAILKLLEVEDDELTVKLQSLADSAKANDTWSNEAELPVVQAEQFMSEILDDTPRQTIATDIPTLDRTTQGLSLGSVSVLGAFPSAGKTALAMNLVRSTVARGQKSMFFSMEMTVQQLYERLAANVCEIPYTALRTKKISPTQIATLRELSNGLIEGKTLYAYDDRYHIEQIARSIIRIQPRLVVVDYLQKVRTVEKITSNAEKLEYLVDEFKRLAAANNCHIMLLSQHSRDATRDKPKASLFNLKGSSGIEAGGDYIMLLDRPYVYDKKQPPEKAALKLVKHKYGELCSVDLWFDGAHQRFREKSSREDFPVARDGSEPW